MNKKLFLPLISMLITAPSLWAQLPSVTLTTAKAVGEKITLSLNGTNCFADLNGNGEKDSGEDFLGNTDDQDFTLASQTLTIYGNFTDLWCYEASLTALDLSKNPELTYVNCKDNQLQRIDLSKNTKLTTLFCSGNQIKGADMTDLVKSLPLHSAQERTSFIVIDSQNAQERNIILKSDVSLAKGKNWTIYDWNGSLREEYDGIDPSLPPTYVSLTTTHRPGSKIKLRVYGEGCFVDLNANGKKDLGEAIPDNTTAESEFTIETQTFKIYGVFSKLWCNDIRLSSLDITTNPDLQILYCQGNSLESLTLSKNTALLLLNCSNNGLKTIDLSQNIALAELVCSGNNLSTLRVENNKSLSQLTCFGNKISLLDLHANPSLTKLYCDNNLISTLDFSNNPVINTISCYSNKIKGEKMEQMLASLPKRSPTDMAQLFLVDSKMSPADENAATMADIATAKEKNWIIWDWNGSFSNGNKDVKVPYEGIKPFGSDFFITITTAKPVGSTINLSVYGSNCYADINGNGQKDPGEAFPENNEGRELRFQINAQTINIYGPTKNFWAFEQELTAIDPSNNPSLVELYCHKNQITAMDVSKNSELETFYCYNNKITNLHLGKQPNLSTLYCFKNELTSLDLTACNALIDLDCSDNMIEELDVTTATELVKLWCNNNDITSLNLSKTPDITQLYCTNNKITALDISSNKRISAFHCSSNELTEINISNQPNLLELFCSENKLAKLDLTSNTELNQLSCHTNRLSALDLTNNKHLSMLACFRNQIKQPEMVQLINSLPSIDPQYEAKLHIIDTKATPKDGNVAYRADVAIAVGKNWTVMDWNGSFDGVNADVSIPYEGSFPESIESTKINDVIITTNNGILHINSTTPKQIRLYSTNGDLIYRNQGSCQATISLTQGVYILRMDSKVQKLVMP